MRNTIFRITCTLISVILLSSCGPSDMIWPSDRIGPMWVNRYGHTNAEFIWDHCDDAMTETPGVQTTECTIPWADELFIGYGIRAVDKSQRDTLWEARTWELYIDGHAVDLPAFNVADFDTEKQEKHINSGCGGSGCARFVWFDFEPVSCTPLHGGILICAGDDRFDQNMISKGLHLKSLLTSAIMFALFMTQGSCGGPNKIATATPFATNTMLAVLNTPMPTKTTSPLQTSSPAPVIQATWNEEPSMLFPRSAHAVVPSETTIFALAGTDDKGRPILDVEAFDGNQWSVETTLPGRGLNAPTASIVGNRLYVVGGFKAVTNIPTDEVQVYDLQSRQWSMVSPLPNPRGGHVAVVLDDKIHALGGGNSVSTIADHSAYDPATDTWKELAPLPRAEGSPAAVVVDGKIYVIGGRSGSSDFGDVYIYDPLTDTWSIGPAIEPRGTAGVVAYCGGIYLFGGESQLQRKNLDSVLRLDLERGIWESVTAMPGPRKFARAVLFMDSVYIVGGSTVPASSHAPIGTASVLHFKQAGCS